MRRISKYLIYLLVMCLCMANLMLDAKAEATGDVITISNYAELMMIAKNPSGTYELSCDIDLAGKKWIPLDFTGTFNGKGHSILNVTVANVGEGTATTYDGNMKTYDTHFAGFFGKLENASVTNLIIVNLKVDIETETPCFVGGFAGYMDKSSISDSTVSGTLSIKTGAKMFGAGGMAGFGNGDIKKCDSDMTLICIDTDKVDKDEQFLGGAYAAGYIGIDHCNIKVQGYDSDHGYVHNGGMVGMFAVYPAGNTFKSYITYNNVEGQITFFEDNSDRRAYCKAYVGEVLHWTYEWGGCTEKFKSNEIFDYSTDLLPEKCSNPSYVETKLESTDDAYGYTEYSCSTCGYTYRDNYQLYKSDLIRIEEEIQASIKESIAASEAESIANEKATQKVTNPVVEKKENDTTKHLGGVVLIIAMAALGVLGTCIVIYSSRKQRRRRRRR